PFLITFRAGLPLGAGPFSWQFAPYEGPGERLPGPARVSHPGPHLRERARPVAGPAAAALGEADARVQQQGEHPPGRLVPPGRGRERGAHVDQRPRAARAGPLALAVDLLVRGAARQADEG